VFTTTICFIIIFSSKKLHTHIKEDSFYKIYTMTTTQPIPVPKFDSAPKTIAIWGGGLVGLSTAAYFARKQISSIIYDVSEPQVSRINGAEFESNFEEWLGFDLKDYVTKGLIRATTDQSELSRASIKTHFVAVTTEHNGEPDMTVVDTVLRNIKTMSPDLCIIESTVIPGSTETLGRKYDLPLGIAGRRDLFLTGDKNLENCTRAYAGLSKELSDRMHTVLSVVCKKLIRASSCNVVELAKVLDNGIFHTMAIFASQVASAYPRVNVAEAFKIAATHWRLGNHIYFPSIGTGGHCVPVANKYLLQGATDSSKLTIASGAVQYDTINPHEVASRIKESLGPGARVAVLGICFRGDVREYTESPHLKFAQELVDLGMSVGIHDPYYSDDDLREISGAIPFNFPEDLRQFDFIYIGSNHKVYLERIYSVLVHMHSGQSILDNQGIWEALAEDARSLGISYRRVGGIDWLPLASKSHISPSFSPGDLTDVGNNIIFKTNYFQIRAIPHENKTISDPWFIMDRPDSVVVIPLSETDNFLFQKQFRPQIGRSVWEFPGGNIDPGEDPVQAAERELLEETTLRPSSFRNLGWFYPIPGLSTQRTHVFLAHVTDQQLSEHLPSVYEEGILAFRVVDVQKVRSLIITGQVIGGITLSALTFWKTDSFSVSCS
jgi:nucleotide sugar dehydrogenase